jgi:hypothetical protein
MKHAKHIQRFSSVKWFYSEVNGESESTALQKLHIQKQLNIGDN